MNKRLYSFLTWLSAIIGVTATFLFDGSPHSVWLAWALAIVAGLMATGAYLYNRLQSDGHTDNKAIVSVANKGLDASQLDSHVRTFEAYYALRKLQTETRRRRSAEIYHIRQLLYKQCWYESKEVDGPRTNTIALLEAIRGHYRSNTNLNNRFATICIPENVPTTQISKDVQAFAFVVNELCSTSIGKEMEYILTRDGTITVRSMRAKTREERLQIGKEFQSISESAEFVH